MLVIEAKSDEMDVLKHYEDKLWNELRDMSMKEEMSIRDLDLVDKMVCILKNIECLQKG